MSSPATSVAVDSPTRPSVDFADRLVTLTQTHRLRLELGLAVVLYLGFACYLTWPLVTELGSSIYGSPGDPYGTIAFYHGLVEHHLNPFLPGTVTQLAAPEGIPIPWPRDLASAPGTLALYLLTLCFGAVPAYGLYTLAGYTLTGVVTFLFARRLTSNAWAALIAGWAFAFYPFAAISGQGHLDFVHGWVLMLGVWRMVELMWLPTRRNGVLAGLAVAFGMWWSPYFILFAGVAYVTVTATVLLIARLRHRIDRVRVPQAIAGAIVAAFLIFLGVLAMAGATEGIGARTHSLRDFYVYAARPLEYLVPDVQSPLFGDATRHYVKTHLYGSSPVEATLYVGITVVLLALVALVGYMRSNLNRRLGRAVLVLWLMVLTAAVTSMPPEMRIAGRLVPFPSHFISQVTETWRVYSRFVMVVMLALSLLAAIGLDLLTRGRSMRVKIAIMSVATIAVPLDLWASQSGHVDKIPTPGIYKVLARQPKGLVAEYPLAASSFNTYSDILYQGIHHQPMINGYSEDTAQELRAYLLSNLANPETAQRLATLGVRYVLVDSSPATWGWPASGKPRTGFRLIAHEPYADLYVVTAHPKNSALATTGKGFLPIKFTKTGIVSELLQPSGEIELIGSCNSCNGVLSMSLEAVRQPREVTIVDSRGHLLAHGSIGLEAKQLSIELHFSRRTTLKLTALPGPAPVTGVTGGVNFSMGIADINFTNDGSAASHR